ncbi:prenyltransferase/squalene oxidase repeat-containing protein [Nocardia arizonensis]|uniref:prenyltransferase/squalene oxidase repeat-containing protein n=1 Tax=Nocardia arizonensis TaxID=1141647 RepID=UPI0006D086B8|nr:prenyltransferase/squalene oxidase repeat-containing protein [Nocardia arizonensis]
MSSLDERIDDALRWMNRNQLSDGHGGAGWGWVPDVPPNPQNTAEVVCALAALGYEIPRSDEVSMLVRQAVVHRYEGHDWPFQAPIDLAWKLRALHCLGADQADPDAIACRQALISEQDQATGGWRMSSQAGPISITATATAIQALISPALTEENAAQSIVKATGFLVSATIDQDPRIEPLYACAHVAATLARPEIAALGGKRLERARNLVVGRLLDGLRRQEARIEEEAFRRGDVSDTWRHLTLHLAVGAVVAADQRTLFDPAVRQALAELLDLQETAQRHAHRGGFRTSASGFVTSYATTQALETMASIRGLLNESINPAKVFDLVCRADGVHHADAQQLLSARGRPMVMNSHAGAALLAVGGPAGLTIALLAVRFADDLGKIGSRALVVWGVLFIATGTFASVSTRLPTVPNGRIAAAVFAAYTAVVLPVVTFLLS